MAAWVVFEGALEVLYNLWAHRNVPFDIPIQVKVNNEKLTLIACTLIYVENDTSPLFFPKAQHPSLIMKKNQVTPN